MEYGLLLWAGVKRHRVSLAGIFALMFLTSLTLCTVLSVRTGAERYLESEMDRMGFGEFTSWVSDVPDLEALEREIRQVEAVSDTGTQNLIFANYEINGTESDSEGQFIVYEPETYPYRIFTDGFSGYQEGAAQIQPGEAYVPASFVSMYGAGVGDTLRITVARQGIGRELTIKGFFEDPFMGSSMIGMKGILICEEDRAEMVRLLEESGIDSLARAGAMVHVEQAEEAAMGSAELNRQLNETTSLTSYAEFGHSKTSILGFMLLLQNVFSGFLAAFAGLLLAAAMIVLSHGIGSAIERDCRNMGILKTMGFTGKELRRIQCSQYLLSVGTGLLAGFALSFGTASLVFRATVTTTGILIPGEIPILLCLLLLTGLLLFLMGFVWLKMKRLEEIAPLSAISRQREAGTDGKNWPALKASGLAFRLSLRQMMSAKRQYASACVVAALLVFFASAMGRVDTWLGPNGEGLMDAFNPADLDLAVQPMGTTTIEEVERLIADYTQVVDQYQLAMPGAAVNGIDYTVNVITEPERFHLLSGETCVEADEVVLTEFVASDLGVSVGDTVTVAGTMGREAYRVSGIYQCANDMGANIGMNREGYLRIGTDDPNIWCSHYFLEEPEMRGEITAALTAAYGGDVYIHENSWPGLLGILSAMDLLFLAMYGLAAWFVLVATVLAGNKLLSMEQRSIGIYKSLGFSTGELRAAFAVRFGLVSLLGAVAGTFLSAFCTDGVIAAVMREYGISGFASHLSLGNAVAPGLAIAGFFLVFAYLSSGKIKKVELTALIAEGDQ